MNARLHAASDMWPSVWGRRLRDSTEFGEHRETLTGTPQGGVLSPLIFSTALSALDEHLAAPWKEGGAMPADYKRAARRRKGLPNWRIIRYADGFAVLVHGSEHDAEALREEIAGVLAGLGLRLSQAKTRVARMSEGGFGERSGETGREQSRNRAPGLLTFEARA